MSAIADQFRFQAEFDLFYQRCRTPCSARHLRNIRSHRGERHPDSRSQAWLVQPPWSGSACYLDLSIRLRSTLANLSLDC